MDRALPARVDRGDRQRQMRQHPQPHLGGQLVALEHKVAPRRHVSLRAPRVFCGNLPPARRRVGRIAAHDPLPAHGLGQKPHPFRRTRRQPRLHRLYPPLLAQPVARHHGRRTQLRRFFPDDEIPLAALIREHQHPLILTVKRRQKIQTAQPRDLHRTPPRDPCLRDLRAAPREFLDLRMIQGRPIRPGLRLRLRRHLRAPMVPRRARLPTVFRKPDPPAQLLVETLDHR